MEQEGRGEPWQLLGVLLRPSALFLALLAPRVGSPGLGWKQIWELSEFASLFVLPSIPSLFPGEKGVSLILQRSPAQPSSNVRS